MKLPTRLVDSIRNRVSVGGFFMTKLIAPAGWGPYIRVAPPRVQRRCVIGLGITKHIRMNRDTVLEHLKILRSMRIVAPVANAQQRVDSSERITPGVRAKTCRKLSLLISGNSARRMFDVFLPALMRVPSTSGRKGPVTCGSESARTSTSSILHALGSRLGLRYREK